MPRLQRLLIWCSMALAGTFVLAGPGVHLLSPCGHEAGHDPGGLPDRDDSCPICALHSQAQAPAPVASVDRPAPAFGPVEAHSDEARRLDLPSCLLPRAPPLA
ncbi:hypothetical protein [Tautonia plasticadhaerens]|uniref:DUF2946 domain-containing protein n=1 Tax=Tautonia plasticadhaerens TaxID=2527974 RepID=A0A518H6S2_9BACT|nr:hypothetical protein [Tautonia plasticadhaerens]QDV36505.1 hypothetical protein ElP_44310 [Tautonia plasticadhaerens]